MSESEMYNYICSSCGQIFNSSYLEEFSGHTTCKKCRFIFNKEYGDEDKTEAKESKEYNLNQLEKIIKGWAG